MPVPISRSWTPISCCAARSGSARANTPSSRPAAVSRAVSASAAPRRRPAREGQGGRRPARFSRRRGTAAGGPAPQVAATATAISAGASSQRHRGADSHRACSAKKSAGIGPVASVSTTRVFASRSWRSVPLTYGTALPRATEVDDGRANADPRPRTRRRGLGVDGSGRRQSAAAYGLCGSGRGHRVPLVLALLITSGGRARADLGCRGGSLENSLACSVFR